MTTGGARATMEMEELHQLATYKKFPFVVERGEDVWIYTSDGDRYLDLYGGHAVVSTGHSHPRVVGAIADQARRLVFYSNLVYCDVRARAARRLTEVAPPPLKKVFFVNSGAEANENAMRLARMSTGRTKIISFEGGFHGRTPGAISATGLAKYRGNAGPLMDGHALAKFGDLDSVGALVDTDTAGILLEPIQSMGGVIRATPDFYRGLRDICEGVGARLIYDEVQTGMGRTGRYFFAGRYDVVPDIVTLAKGIASGIPMGAVLVSDLIAERVGFGDLGTTFGGGPLAAAALEATLDVIREEKLLENVRANSEYLFNRLSGMSGVEEVRGLGYLMGIKFRGVGAPEVQRLLLERRIVTGLADDPAILRLLPPLTLARREIDYFLGELSSLGLSG